jgi:hypothetical protein
LLVEQVVAGVVKHKVEILEECGQNEDSFLPSKGTTDTSPHAVAKRLPAVRELLIPTVKDVIQHPLWLELGGVLAVDGGVEM